MPAPSLPATDARVAVPAADADCAMVSAAPEGTPMAAKPSPPVSAFAPSSSIVAAMPRGIAMAGAFEATSTRSLAEIVMSAASVTWTRPSTLVPVIASPSAERVRMRESRS